jgi:hypothetical protein
MAYCSYIYERIQATRLSNIDTHEAKVTKKDNSEKNLLISDQAWGRLREEHSVHQNVGSHAVGLL